jgi:hypothetical protein
MTDEYVMEEMEGGFFTTSSNYLESLIKSRMHLKDAPTLLKKLDETIDVELDLALIGARKARGEVLKEQAKDNVVPIGRSNKNEPPEGGTAA